MRCSFPFVGHIVLILLFEINTLGQRAPDEPFTYKEYLQFEWLYGDSSVQLLARSESYAPLEITVKDRKTKELLSTYLLEPFDSLTVIQAFGDSLKALANTMNDSVAIGYFLGHPEKVNPDLSYSYRLPFAKGKKVEVAQSFNGKRTTHKSKINLYAIDFEMDIGDAVHAARAGRVIKAVDWFTKKGGPELKDAANRIIIMHDDGTIASYVHLDYKGTVVNEGDWVEKGQLIGRSGLTGYTRGPHLHFVVRRERDIAIRVRFEGYEDEELKKGKYYKVKK